MNVVVVMSDEHNATTSGYGGHPVVRTPNLDALAQAGTVFDAAYTASPICVPARAAWATGRPVREIGFWDNAIAYDGTVPGWGHALQNAGVRVESIGKLHYRTEADATGFDRQIEPMHLSTGDEKLHHYVGFDPELFDLADDPDELHDVAADDRYAEQRRSLEQVLFAACDPEAVDRRAKAAQAALVELFGGRDAALATGTVAQTPAPKA